MRSVMFWSGKAGEVLQVAFRLGLVRCGRRVGFWLCVVLYVGVRYVKVRQVGYVSLWHVLFLWGKLRQAR